MIGQFIRSTDEGNKCQECDFQGEVVAKLAKVNAQITIANTKANEEILELKAELSKVRNVNLKMGKRVK